MEDLVAHVRSACGDAAAVSLERGQGPGARLMFLGVEPHRAEAEGLSIAFGLADEEHTTVVELTVLLDGGGRWEIGVEDRDLAFARQVVDAVVAGRVTVQEGKGRSETTLILADGSRTSSSVGSLLPRPGWRARTPVRRCAPYRPV
ncbi:hypothetical protein [Micrococcus flavus]|uniref:hypothetical protein n=2 Tax=Micrococcus flavus TaxID=384602 RepID=UPI00166DFDE4